MSTSWNSAQVDEDYLARLRTLAVKVNARKGNLCGLLENAPSNWHCLAEMETILAQTVTASIANLDGEAGEPFSFVPKGGLRSSFTMSVDNVGALANLQEVGWIVTEQRGDREVLFVTPAVFDLLEAYFQRRGL